MRFRRWLSITVLLAVVVVGIGVLMPVGQIDPTLPYHPFKSEQAKETFLHFYDKRSTNWPVESETRLVNTSSGQTFVRISGFETAPPLVLLHGVSGNSLQWTENVEILSQHYRVFSIDIIGEFGRSVNRIELSGANDYVNWLDELFDALDLGNSINLAGLSYGGWIAAQYALKHQERLDRIVLLAPVGTIQPISLGWVARAISVAIPHKYFTRNFMYWLAEDTVNTGPAGRAVVDEYIDEAFLAMRSFESRRMVNPNVLSDEELSSIYIPVLVLVGENERIFSPQAAIKRINEVAPNFQARIIKNAGHDLTLVEPEAVNRAMIDFLGRGSSF